MRKSEQIGELLIQKNLITQEQLETALEEQKRSKEPLGRILLRLGFVQNELQLKSALSVQLDIPLIPAEELKPKIDQRLKELIPKEIALERLILPLERHGNHLKLAIGTVPDIILMDNLRKITGCEVSAVLATEADIRKAIGQFYDTTELEEVVSSSAIREASKRFGAEAEEEKPALESIGVDAGHAPVVRLVDVLLKKAIDDRASDIHIEPFKRAFRSAIGSTASSINFLRPLGSFISRSFRASRFWPSLTLPKRGFRRTARL